MEDSERIFSKLARLVERKRLEVKALIRSQEKEALAKAEAVLQALEQHSTQLDIRDYQLDRLAQTDDHIHFLQRSRSLESAPDVGDLPGLELLPHSPSVTMRRSLRELRQRLEELLARELTPVSDTLNKEDVVSTPKSRSIRQWKSVEDLVMQSANPPRTRADLLQYCCELTLDPNTANSFLSLKEALQEVTTGRESHAYPAHPERFMGWAQVLCREGLTGRRYWEAEWRGGGGVSVALAYRSMRRNVGSSEGKLGHNARSWSLDVLDSACYFQHHTTRVDIPVAPTLNRIGVYLDHDGGLLAFYSVADAPTLLHTVQTSFSQPLYPGFWVGLGTTLRICPFFNFAA